MIMSCTVAEKNRSFKYVILGLFVYSLFMGLRYGMGTDFFAYKQLYYQIKEGIHTYHEVLFVGLMKSFSLLNFEYGHFCFFISFLQVFLLFYAFKKEYYLWKPLAIVFLLSGTWLSFMNGVRQELAFCLFVFSLQYIVERRLLMYVLCIFSAFLLHKSAILLLVIYPLFLRKKNWINNINIQLLILFLSIMIMQLDVIQQFLISIDYFVNLLGYSNYLDNLDSEHVKSEIRLGPGFYTLLFLDFICIVFNRKVKSYFEDDKLNIIYSLYFIGIPLRYIFLSSLIVARLNYYFIAFRIIFLSYLLFFLYKKGYVLSFFFVMIFLVVIFVATLYRWEENTSIYIFNWQKELFYLQPYSYLDI